MGGLAELAQVAVVAGLLIIIIVGITSLERHSELLASLFLSERMPMDSQMGE